MAQVGGQQGQLRFDICACSVPAQESIHGKTVPKVVNPWQLSFGSDDTALLKQGFDGVAQARAAIRSATPRRVPDESRI
jgi:hypothetical protein